jgi:hypothetical protein
MQNAIAGNLKKALVPEADRDRHQRLRQTALGSPPSGMKKIIAHTLRASLISDPDRLTSFNHTVYSDVAIKFSGGRLSLARYDSGVPARSGQQHDKQERSSCPAQLETGSGTQDERQATKYGAHGGHQAWPEAQQSCLTDRLPERQGLRAFFRIARPRPRGDTG